MQTPHYNDKVYQALNDICYPWLHAFVVDRLKRAFKDQWWDRGVLGAFTRESPTYRELERWRNNPGRGVSELDVYALLGIIRRSNEFSELGEDGRIYIDELRRYRNRLSHRNIGENQPFFLEEAHRALDTIMLLLRRLGGHREADQVGDLAAGLLQLRSAIEARRHPVITAVPFAALTTSISGTQPNLVRRIEEFFHEYFGSSGNPTPFGGRGDMLTGLNDWLTDGDRPYALLNAPAGRGKSALLSRWVASLAEGGVADVAFVPISIRFNTATKSAASSLLGARLAYLDGLAIDTRTIDPDGWLAEIERIIRTDRPDTAVPLLVVLDGADEAIGWEIGRDLLFPAQPGRGVKVLVSTRTLAHRDGAGWLRQLGWEQQGVLFDLPLLDLLAVGEALKSGGEQLIGLLDQQALVQELYRLSEGEPLLVRLYVEALRGVGEQAAFLTPEGLRNLRPGLEAYLERWWDDQRRQWGSETPLREPTVRALLNLLACALGPLSRDDLLALARPERLDTWLLDEALQRLGRFVIGDGSAQGYVFSHPRLSQHFYEHLQPQERAAWEQRFLGYGRETLNALRGEHRDAHIDAPAYVVRYYRLHLERAGATIDAFDALVCWEWLRAWEALEGTYEGFLDDLTHIWELVDQYGEETNVAAGSIDTIGKQCRYALIFSSINSLTGNLSTELLASLVEHKVWTPAQALAYIQRHPDEEQRAELLVALALLLPEELIHDVLPRIREGIYGEYLAQVLIALSAQLWEDERLELLREAHTIAEQLPDGVERARILVALAPYLPDINVEDALARALYDLISFEEAEHQERDTMNWVFHLGENLLWIIKNLPEALVPLGLQALRYYHNYCDLATILPFIAPRLSKEQLQESIAIARSYERADVRRSAIQSFLPYIKGTEHEALVTEVLEEAQKLDEISQSVILIELAPYIADSHVPQVLALIARSSMLWPFFQVSSQVASAVAANLPPTLLPALIQAIRQKSLLPEQAICLAQVAIYFPEDDRQMLLDEALATARSMEHPVNRAGTLLGVAQSLSDTQRLPILIEALDTVRTIERWTDRARAVEVMSAFMEIDASDEQRAASHKLHEFFQRQKIMTAIAAHLPQNERAAILMEVLEDVRIISTSEEWLWSGDHSLVAQLTGLGYTREALGVIRTLPTRESNYQAPAANALQEFIPRLAARYELEVMLPDVLSIVARIAEPEHRVETLLALANDLSDNQCQTVLHEALAAARTIGDVEERVALLVKLAPYLREAERSELLSIATRMIPAIPDVHPNPAGPSHDPRAELLLELVPHLPEHGLPEVEAILQGIEIDQYDNVDILELLAQRLPPLLLQSMLQATPLLDIDTDWQWVDVLLKRVVAAGEIETAVGAIQARHDAADRAWLFMSLAEQMPLLERDHIVADALDEAQSIEIVERRAQILAGLLPMLGAPARRMAVIDILEMIALIPKDLERAFVLRAIAPYVLIEQWPTVLMLVLSIEGDHSRSVALAGFAPHLPDSLLLDAIRAAQLLRSAENRCKTLTSLAQRLSGDARDELLEEALIAMLQMNDFEKQHPGLSVLNREPRFGGHPTCTSAQLLVELTAQLPESLQRDALSVAQDLPGSVCRAEALVALASLLRPALLSDLINALPTIQHEHFQTQALIALVPHLPETLLEHVLSVAREIKDEYLRVQAIVSVASRLHPDARNSLLVETLEIAHSIQRPLTRAAALVEPAPYFPPALMQRALEEVRAIAAVDARAHALLRLIPCFAEAEREDLVIEAVDITMTYLSHRWQREALAQLAPHLVRLPRSKLYKLWCDMLYTLAETSRAALLADLKELTPVIATLGGQAALTECAQAIIEISSLFP